jgi:hypothetical protein
MIPRFPPTEEQKEEAKEKLAEEGFTYFQEDAAGWNVALKLAWLVEHAVEIGYDAQSIADELGYKLKAVEKVLVHYDLLEEDETSLTEFEYSHARRRAPFQPKPHPRTVHRPSGQADKTPW